MSRRTVCANGEFSPAVSQGLYAGLIHRFFPILLYGRIYFGYFRKKYRNQQSSAYSKRHYFVSWILFRNDWKSTLLHHFKFICYEKIILSYAAVLLAAGSACAAPEFLSLNNKHGKTTIKIEIPASDRDETNGLSIEDVVLYNDGKTFQAKKVDAIWGDNSIVILQFEKLTAFEDCTLSFSVNGKPVSLDIQSCLADRK